MNENDHTDTPKGPENPTGKDESFGAQRRAGLPPSIFEEIGLTIDEIPENENPWKDPRYVTQVSLPDSATGQVFYFSSIQRNS